MTAKQALARAYVAERWKALTRESDRVAIYGGGRFARQLLQLTRERKLPVPALVIDDEPDAGPVDGVPNATLEEAKKEGFGVGNRPILIAAARAEPIAQMLGRVELHALRAAPIVEREVVPLPDLFGDASPQWYGEPQPMRGLFLNCLPKSASYYLADAFCAGLHAPFDSPQAGVFPENRLAVRRTQVGAGNGTVMRGHISPDRTNLRVLFAVVDRMVLHLRDPRDAAASLYKRVEADGPRDPVFRAMLGLEDTFFERSPESRADWFVQTYAPSFAHWTQDWLTVIERDPACPPVLVTTFEEFHNDARSFVSKVLRFHDRDPDCFDWAAVKPPERGKQNYRQGRVGDFVNVFNARQQAQMNSLLPAALRERFAWP